MARISPFLLHRSESRPMMADLAQDVGLSWSDFSLRLIRVSKAGSGPAQGKIGTQTTSGGWYPNADGDINLELLHRPQNTGPRQPPRIANMRVVVLVLSLLLGVRSSPGA